MTGNDVALPQTERQGHDFTPASTRATRRAEAHDSFDMVNDLPMASSPPLSVALPVHGVFRSFILSLHADLDTVAAEWRRFEQVADCTVFQTFSWLAKLHEHVGTARGTQPAIVFGRDERGALLFILPLAIEAHGPLRCLTWLGSELCDYNMPILAKEFSEAVTPERFATLWRETIALMRAERLFRFDWIDLQKMPDLVGTQRNPFAGLDVAVHPSGAYVATLGQSWDAYYAQMRSASTRKRERRQFKHLAEHGEVRLVDVKERADIARTVDTLIRQKSQSFARMGVHDLMARPGCQAFYRDITTDADARDVIHVSRLDVGTQAVATGLGLRFRGSYYLILTSYEDGALTRFGPGRAHLNELIRHAIAGGFRHFDFTVGDEPYKRDWSDIELTLYDYLAPATLRGRLVVGLVRTFRRAKRFIKQTPALWHAFSKARSLVASLRRR
jgi:CelD/BcsL family acetyltransferase involved in cellulose biosynthesis